MKIPDLSDFLNATACRWAHLCYGKKGVFSIETKFRSKPEGRNEQINVTSDGIAIGDRKPSMAIINQARAQSGWLRNLMKSRINQEPPTKPAILFPGWYIKSDSQREIWVLEPKAFLKFFSNEADCITQNDVQLIASDLKDYVRKQLNQ